MYKVDGRARCTHMHGCISFMRDAHALYCVSHLNEPAHYHCGPSVQVRTKWLLGQPEREEYGWSRCRRAGATAEYPSGEFGGYRAAIMDQMTNTEIVPLIRTVHGNKHCMQKDMRLMRDVLHSFIPG
jgi:hypothetical protein